MSITETVGVVRASSPAAPGVGRLSARAQLAFAAVVFAACLAPAAINGYPLVFPDTEGYLLAAAIFRPQFVRAFGYGAFIGATGGMLSLWLTAAAQAALTAWLATRAVALESPRWPDAWRLPVTLALLAVVLLSHAPWLAAWLQPDLFTGLMALSLFLLAEHRDRISKPEQALLFAALIGCATMHLTHPPLLAGIGLFALGALALGLPLRAPPGVAARARRVAGTALLAAALGWAALGAANWITYKRFTDSLGGSVFLFARLAADGDVGSALRPECDAGRPWAACRFLDRFNLTADEFLWRGWSPLAEMGHGSGFMSEAAEINPVLLREVWPNWLGKSALRTVRQLASFELGDGMDDEGTWMMADNLPNEGLSHIADAVNGTLQATDGIRGFLPRPTAETLAVTGLTALVALLVFGARRRRPELWWPALLFLVLYLGNAALIALGGEVHARYGARLVWLAPLLAGLLALRAACPPEAEPKPAT